MKIGINGLGRMGRLTLRSSLNRFQSESTRLAFVQSNDPAGDAKTMAHLMEFDSIHGRWDKTCSSQDNTMVLAGHEITHTQNQKIDDTDWSACDIVL